MSRFERQKIWLLSQITFFSSFSKTGKLYVALISPHISKTCRFDFTCHLKFWEIFTLECAFSAYMRALWVMVIFHSHCGSRSHCVAVGLLAPLWMCSCHLWSDQRRCVRMAPGKVLYPSVFVVDSKMKPPPLPPKPGRRQRKDVIQTLLVILVCVAICGMAVEACFIYHLFTSKENSVSTTWSNFLKHRCLVYFHSASFFHSHYQFI